VVVVVVGLRLGKQPVVVVHMLVLGWCLLLLHLLRPVLVHHHHPVVGVEQSA
jgi:hypothetical protein